MPPVLSGLQNQLLLTHLTEGWGFAVALLPDMPQLQAVSQLLGCTMRPFLLGSRGLKDHGVCQSHSRGKEPESQRWPQHLLRLLLE